MASTSTTRIVRSDNELQKPVALIEDVDSVELKLTVPEPAQVSTARALGLGFLTSRGIDLDADQQTKTRTALEFFARGP